MGKERMGRETMRTSNIFRKKWPRMQREEVIAGRGATVLSLFESERGGARGMGRLKVQKRESNCWGEVPEGGRAGCGSKSKLISY